LEYRKVSVVFWVAIVVSLHYTLTNKGASRCHRRTFLSKWFHKEPLTSEEPFCFTKGSLWQKEGLDYKKVRKRWFFVEPEMVLLWHRLKYLYF